jgi:hypothetical protein
MPSVPLRTTSTLLYVALRLYLIFSYAVAETLLALSLNCTYTVLTPSSANTVAT